MTIYKYNVPGIYNIPLKQVLDTQIQRDQIVVWCMIDEELPEERICFNVCGTGGMWTETSAHMSAQCKKMIFMFGTYFIKK